MCEGELGYKAMYVVHLEPLDSIGPEESALIREVSLFLGLKCSQMQHSGRENVS